ncbi:MAG: ABC transporter ATP-binding protein [Caulobacterales bacterium]
MPPVLSIRDVSKTYKGGFQALKSVSLDIQKGEIFALLGPNGAGKTTLISAICGIVEPSTGTITAAGLDTRKHYRTVRAMIGLVPQELTTDAFETVWDITCFSRGLFGHAANPQRIEEILKDLSLWDKRDAKILTLSGGMKRRVMIAKALAHEPEILFLDEPTAGVDVELRRDMWALVRKMRDRGATIILTTHYIDEAEEMADRIGVVLKGELILVEDKAKLIKKLGQKRLKLQLQNSLAAVPDALSGWPLTLKSGGRELEYVFDVHAENGGARDLLAKLDSLGIVFTDLSTETSSLEDIFVDLVESRA